MRSVAWVALICVAAAIAQGEQGSSAPDPYISKGACPFECCSYREWIANRDVTVMDKPRREADRPFAEKRSGLCPYRRGRNPSTPLSNQTKDFGQRKCLPSPGFDSLSSASHRGRLLVSVVSRKGDGDGRGIHRSGPPIRVVGASKISFRSSWMGSDERQQ